MDKTIMPNRVQSQSMAAYWDKWKKSIVVLLSTCIASCSSIGPIMVPRDRVEYTDAIGHSWEQQTLLNIVKLRYGHAPVFLSITQIVTGYQFQGTASAELIASTFNPATNAFGFSGTTSAEGQYTDRPSIIYAPLTGVDFLQKLMTPIPPSTILFLPQAGASARPELVSRATIRLGGSRCRASPLEPHRHMLNPRDQIRFQPLDLACKLDMLYPREQIRQHEAQFKPRQMGAGAEMLALAKRDMLVGVARQVEAIRIAEDGFVAIS